MVVESGFMRYRFTWIFGCAGELKGLGSVKRCAEADFSFLVSVYLFITKEKIRVGESA